MKKNAIPSLQKEVLESRDQHHLRLFGAHRGGVCTTASLQGTSEDSTEVLDRQGVGHERPGPAEKRQHACEGVFPPQCQSLLYPTALLLYLTRENIDLLFFLPAAQMLFSN